MTILGPSVLIGSTSFLQETRTCMKAWMSMNSKQIRPMTKELPAIEPLKRGHKFVDTLAPSFLLDLLYSCR